MSKARIYFQRAGQFWSETEDPRVNGYLNLLKYVKADVNEKMVNIALGGEIPYLQGGTVQGERIEKEKNLSYAFGLYYEEYYHDDPAALFRNIHRNLKMRIAMVMVEIPDPGRDENAPPLAVVCCGTDEEKGSIVIVDPLTGEYKEMNLEDGYAVQGRRKMFLLNVPGMVKMKGIAGKDVIRRAVNLYKKRFFFPLYNPLSSSPQEIGGVEFFRYCREKEMEPLTIEGYEEHRNRQLSWIGQVESWKREAGERGERDFIEKVMEYYEPMSPCRERGV